MSTQPSNIPVLPAPQDYTGADFAACRTVLQNDVNQAFPQWTDFNRSSPGNVLLLGMCYVLDILTKYQNDQARETFWATVQRRKNALALARGTGVRLKGLAAATVDVTFSIPVAIANDIVIPANFVVLSTGIDETVEFRTIAEATLAAGNTSVMVSVRNSRPRQDLFESDGTANQRFRTTITPYVEQTSVVTIDGDIWTRVDALVNSGPTDQHYTTEVDESDRLFVITGNGVNGKLAPIGQFTTDYQTGGGSDGNVQAAVLTTIGGSLLDVAGNVVNASVTNAAAATGGTDRETVEQARRRVPGALRALTRTVSLEDFEINALGVEGVARTMMLTSTEDATVPDNEGHLLILAVADPPSVPSSAALKAAVLAQVTTVFPTIITFLVTVLDPTLNTIAVTCEVKRKDGFTEPQVEANINAALKAFFDLEDANGAPNSNVDFGSNLVDNLVSFSDLFKTVAGAAGVERVEEDTFLPADDVVIMLREFPVLGTVTVTFL